MTGQKGRGVSFLILWMPWMAQGRDRADSGEGEASFPACAGRGDCLLTAARICPM